MPALRSLTRVGIWSYFPVGQRRPARISLPMDISWTSMPLAAKASRTEEV